MEGGGVVSDKLRFLDLFSGAGGLSEGFIRAGFEPVAHVESEAAACFTLRTRMAFHWLKSKGKLDIYSNYLNGKISRTEFYDHIPDEVIRSIINAEIGQDTISNIFQDIESLLKAEKINLIIGGPPCQAYSLVGRSRDENRMQGDKRNYLYKYYAEFLKRYNPLYFVFENVTGLLSAKDSDGKFHFDAMRELFSKCGYETDYRVLSAEDYGVLQARKRIILVGRKKGNQDFYPEPDKWSPNVTVEEVFKDLPHIHAGEGSFAPCRLKNYRGTWQIETGIRDEGIPVTWHAARSNKLWDLEIYRIAVKLWNKEKTRLNYNMLPKKLKMHRNRSSFLDRFKVVAADLPYSQTVVAHIAKDGHYYIHPDIKQNRSITPREAARLQTFPDNYFFEGESEKPSRTAAFSQIGNAVPVLLSYKIAKKLKESWS